MAPLDAWLSLTREKVMEPDLPICDAHHHLRRYGERRCLVPRKLRDTSEGYKQD